MTRALVLVLLVLSLPARGATDEPVPQGIPAPPPVVERAATGPDATDRPVVQGTSSRIDLMEGAGPALSPQERSRRIELTKAMHAELDALRERTLTRVTELSASRAKAAGMEATLQFERSIADLKQAEILESLRIQARYAREVGSEDLAARIDAAIALLLNPVIDTTTADRAPRPRPER